MILLGFSWSGTEVAFKPSTESEDGTSVNCKVYKESKQNKDGHSLRRAQCKFS